MNYAILLSYENSNSDAYMLDEPLIIIDGNKHFNSINADNDIYNTLVNDSNFEYAFFDIVEKYKDRYFRTFKELYNDYFNIELSHGDIVALNKAIKNINSSKNTYENIAVAMSIISGQKWNTKTIHGGAQSEWNIIYYNEILNDSIDYIEGVYFNTGREVAIYVGEKESPSYDEILENCFYSYTVDYNYKKNIANIIGCNEENLTLYEQTSKRVLVNNYNEL